MAGTYSIQNSKEVVALVATLAKALAAASADGKFDLGDIGQFITLLPVVGPALADVGVVPKELGELDAAEKKELKTYIEDLFGEGQFELIGENAMLVAFHLIALVQAFQKPSA